ncbi:hypothetical protein GCM10010170_102550 [Dactylosporangium salmoneum]|uniref:Uncharacterized protein n=1 Tax=Dactylosporangium salmoneum TaxID=53361 RepID=A0ABP5V2I9_9ACTN
MPTAAAGGLCGNGGQWPLWAPSSSHVGTRYPSRGDAAGPSLDLVARRGSAFRPYVGSLWEGGGAAAPFVPERVTRRAPRQVMKFPINPGTSHPIGDGGAGDAA